MSGLPLFESALGWGCLHYTHVAVLLKLWFRRSASATFAGSEIGGRHRVSYVCEYYEVLHMWHYTHPGANTTRGLRTSFGYINHFCGNVSRATDYTPRYVIPHSFPLW